MSHGINRSGFASVWRWTVCTLSDIGLHFCWFWFHVHLESIHSGVVWTNHDILCSNTLCTALLRRHSDHQMKHLLTQSLSQWSAWIKEPPWELRTWWSKLNNEETIRNQVVHLLLSAQHVWKLFGHFRATGFADGVFPNLTVAVLNCSQAISKVCQAGGAQLHAGDGWNMKTCKQHVNIFSKRAWKRNPEEIRSFWYYVSQLYLHIYQRHVGISLSLQGQGHVKHDKSDSQQWTFWRRHGGQLRSAAQDQQAGVP